MKKHWKKLLITSAVIVTVIAGYMWIGYLKDRPVLNIDLLGDAQILKVEVSCMPAGETVSVPREMMRGCETLFNEKIECQAIDLSQNDSEQKYGATFYFKFIDEMGEAYYITSFDRYLIVGEGENAEWYEITSKNEDLLAVMYDEAVEAM